MKIKKILIIALAVIGVSTAGYLYADSQTTVAKISASAVTHQNLDELESRSDLIVTGKPIGSENHVIKDEEGFVQEGFTITKFEIDGIYANQQNRELEKGDVIKVAEPYYTVDNGIKPGKTEFIIDEYKKMDNSDRYILVLKMDLTYPDLNVIVGVNEGNYSLSNTQSLQADQNKGFKEELINKYNIK